MVQKVIEVLVQLLEIIFSQTRPIQYQHREEICTSAEIQTDLKQSSFCQNVQ